MAQLGFAAYANYTQAGAAVTAHRHGSPGRRAARHADLRAPAELRTNRRHAMVGGIARMSYCKLTPPLADAPTPSRHGTKAVTLHALAAAGLPVPAAVVLDTQAVAELDEARLQACRVALAHPPAYAVRSSMNVEDHGDHRAPGVFLSLTSISADELASAVAQVQASASSPIALSYARAAGLDTITPAVIVQAFVPGEALVIYTQDGTDGMLVQRRGQAQRMARSDAHPAIQLARHVEAVLATSSLDIELIEDLQGRLWVVQARALPRATHQAPPYLFAALPHSDQPWRLDRTHNPEPLSPAQQGLVELIEQAGVAPYELRLVGGYLYARRLAHPRMAQPASPSPLTTPAAYAAAWAEVVTAMAATLTPEPSELEASLEAYVAFYAVWAQRAAPLIAQGKTQLRAALDAQPHATKRERLASLHRPNAIEAQLRAWVRGELTTAELQHRIGDVARAWDVASPTYREAWPDVEAALTALTQQGVTPAPTPPAFDDPRLQLGALAVGYAEEDDLWFYRAQAMVRRALLRWAEGHDVAPHDVFWIPLAQLRQATPPLGPAAVRIAAANRAAHSRARRWHMPLEYGGATSPASPKPFEPYGHGELAGRVWRLDTNPCPPSVRHQSVIVARVLTPGLVLDIIGAAGVICVDGGPLDHGPAMARELGLPFRLVSEADYAACHHGANVETRGATLEVLP